MVSTHQEIIDALDTDIQWNYNPANTTLITYTFNSLEDNDDWSNEPITNRALLTQEGITDAEIALGRIEDVANIQFTRDDNATQSGQADITFKSAELANINLSGVARFPFNVFVGTDVFIDDDTYTNQNFPWDPMLLFMHEIGHALGLAHPYDTSQGTTTLPADEDTHNAMVMSNKDSGVNSVGGFAALGNGLRTPNTLQIYDILVLQHMYGANYTHNAGGTTYYLDDGRVPTPFSWFIPPFQGNYVGTIWDGDSSGTSANTDIDTYNSTRFNGNVTLELREGLEYVTRIGGTYLWTAFGSGIENAISGDGNDLIYGNDLNNNLRSQGGNDTIYGGKGNDTLSGEAGADILYGEDGDDSLNASVGADTIYGGKGNDTINGILGSTDGLLAYGEEGNDHLIGKLYTGDTLVGGVGNDTLEGDFFDFFPGVVLGDDSLIGDAGNDLLKGNGGNDTLLGGNDADTLIGGDGNDSLDGGFEQDSLVGGDGNDTLDGDDQDDTIWGGLGNDSLIGSFGNDILDGQEGTDTVDGGFGDDFISNFTTGTVLAFGGYGNDTLAGSTDGDDTLHGEFGDDSIYGGAGTGNDQLYGDYGKDTLDGAAGNDLLSGGHGNDQIFGGDGDDTLIGGFGYELLDGGDGTDTTDYSYYNGGIKLDFGTGTTHFDAASNYSDPGNDTISSIENVIGSLGNDDITADALANRLEGKDGSDTIVAAGGDDTVDGGNNADLIYGDNGNDQLAGGQGLDTIYGGAGNDNITGDVGRDTLRGDDGNDTISGGDDKDDLFGGKGNDFIDGGDGDDRIKGQQQDDTILGGSGNDLLIGEGGNDSLDGGIGNDALNGGFGNDTIIGGDGTDTASFGGPMANFIISVVNGVTTVISTAYGTDTVAEVEFLNFTDGFLTWDAGLDDWV